MAKLSIPEGVAFDKLHAEAVAEAERMQLAGYDRWEDVYRARAKALEEVADILGFEFHSHRLRDGK